MSDEKEVKYELVGKRPDSCGLFWDEPTKIKAPPKEKIKRTPPEPTWLEPDWLPNYDEAIKWEPDLFTPAELWEAANQGEKVVFDIEHYPGYWLIMFKSITSGKICYFELGAGYEINMEALRAVATKFCLIGFNSNSYDIPMLTLVLNGCTFEQIAQAEYHIIKERFRPYDVYKMFKARSIEFNHIDLIEVAPLQGSLKEYGGRMHTRHMQDLPFEPAKPLVEFREEKIAILRFYCANDLTNTEDLYWDLEERIVLREALGVTYGLDLRSKSDAQIAEAVIASELKKLTGKRPQKQEVLPGTTYYYQAPHFMQFKTELMQWVLKRVCATPFVISETGNILMPEDWKENKKLKYPGMKFSINNTTYQMGLGGLHSCESKRAVFADEDNLLLEIDVTSYYPFIILNLGLAPEHLGPDFLRVFKTIVDRRLQAKEGSQDALLTASQVEHWQMVADSLKITINGTFGKLGSRWSIMYSPNLLLQVTLTGQLSLLFLIEKLELAGIPVVSANTDGIVTRCPKNRRDDFNAIVKEWENETNFNMEETEYLALISQSVNSYLAVKKNLSVKGKGSMGRGLTRLHKNPVHTVSMTAMELFLSTGKPIEQTVRECADVREFVSVRKVAGGAVQAGEFLGKCVRWYYSNNSPGEIIYAKSGNMVSKSTGGRALMQLDSDNTIPEDLDYDYYINETYKMLADAGYEVQVGIGQEH